MNPSETDRTLLDEKIARIREKNEMIIKRRQEIEEEIEIAKKHNAMVDVNGPKTIEEDDRPSLYSDKIVKSHREEPRRSVPKKVNYKPRNNNSREDVAWRAERDEIDRERIRRQRADSGWKREWDADKTIPDDELMGDSLDRRSRSRNTSFSRSSHNESVSTEQSEPVSTQHRDKPKTNIPVKQSELPESTRLKQNVLTERSELPAPPKNLGRGRGRTVTRADKSNDARNVRQTTSEVYQKVKEKAPLKKRVSWGNENELINSPRISLKDDDLKNIRVKVTTTDSHVRNLSVEMTEERGPLVKSQKLSKFDEKTSFSIKLSVPKVSLNQTRVNLHAIEDAAHQPKPKESLKKNELKSIITRTNGNKQDVGVASDIPPAEGPSKDETDADDDSDWEDVTSDEE